MKIIGTCSKCGGPVSVETIYYGITPPAPTCQQCFAVKAQGFGPVIEMTPLVNQHTLPHKEQGE